MNLVVFLRWVGPVPYLELFWAGPVKKLTLYLVLVGRLGGILEGYLREVTIGQQKEGRHPMGTFRPPFHGLDP